MAAPPLRNEEGCRILCAINIKRGGCKTPSIDAPQVRAAWGELAGLKGSALKFIVLPPTGSTGSGVGHDIRAHVTITEDKRSKEMRKTYHLSGTGERRRRHCRCRARRHCPAANPATCCPGILPERSTMWHDGALPAHGSPAPAAPACPRCLSIALQDCS